MPKYTPSQLSVIHLTWCSVCGVRKGVPCREWVPSRARRGRHGAQYRPRGRNHRRRVRSAQIVLQQRKQGQVVT